MSLTPGPWSFTSPEYDDLSSLPRRDRQQSARSAPEGFIYVIEFSFGTVKVGETSDARMRMRQHFKDAQKFGGAIRRMWVSDAHPGWRDNEMELIIACAHVSPRAGSEYFTDLDFDSVVKYAETLQIVASVVPQTPFPAFALDAFDEWCRQEGALSLVRPCVANQ